MDKNLNKQLLMTFLTYDVFFEMCKNPKLKLFDAVKEVKTYNSIESKIPLDVFAGNMLKYSLSSIVRQCFVLQKEEIDISNLDESLKDGKNLISKTREKLTGKNIGNLQLYKMIRDAFVHNNPEDPNFYIDERLHYHFKIKQKKQEPFELELYVDDVIRLLLTFNANFEVDQKITYVHEQNLDTAIKDRTLSLDNIDNFAFVTINGVKENADEFQKAAFIRFLYKTSPYYEGMYHIPNASWQIVSGHYPLKENSSNLFLDNLKLIGFLTFMLKNGNKTLTDYLKEYTQKYLSENCPFREFIICPVQYDICDTLLVANMFNLLMSTTIENTKSFVDRSGYNYTLEEVRHLRNALAHGRYFYTYNKYNGIEIYDGTKTLEHIRTFSVDDFFMILNHYLNEIVDEIESSL